MKTLATIVVGLVLVLIAYISAGLGFDAVYPCPFDFYPDCDPDRFVRIAVFCLYGFLTMIVLALVVRLAKQPRAAFIALLICLVLPIIMLVASGFEIYRLLNYQPDLDLSNIENLGEAMELDFSIAEWWSEAYAGMTFALAAIFLTVLQYLFAMRFLGRPAAVSSSEERASAHNKATASSEAGKTTSPAIAQPPEPDLPIWHIGRGDAQHGPYSDRQFGEILKSGQFQPGDLVWREGWGNWVPAEKAIEAYRLAKQQRAAAANETDKSSKVAAGVKGQTEAEKTSRQKPSAIPGRPLTWPQIGAGIFSVAAIAVFAVVDPLSLWSTGSDNYAGTASRVHCSDEIDALTPEQVALRLKEQDDTTTVFVCALRDVDPNVVLAALRNAPDTLNAQMFDALAPHYDAADMTKHDEAEKNQDASLDESIMAVIEGAIAESHPEELAEIQRRAVDALLAFANQSLDDDSVPPTIRANPKAMEAIEKAIVSNASQDGTASFALIAGGMIDPNHFAPVVGSLIKSGKASKAALKTIATFYPMLAEDATAATTSNNSETEVPAESTKKPTKAVESAAAAILKRAEERGDVYILPVPVNAYEFDGTGKFVLAWSSFSLYVVDLEKRDAVFRASFSPTTTQPGLILGALKQAIFSPDGKYVAANIGTEVQVIDWRARKKVFSTKSPNELVEFKKLAFAQSSSKLVVISNLKRDLDQAESGLLKPGEAGLSLWDVESGKMIANAPAASLESSTINSLAVDPAGTKAAVAGFRALDFYDLVSGVEAGQLKRKRVDGEPSQDGQREAHYKHLAFSPDGKRLLATGHRGALHILDSSDGSILADLTGHNTASSNTVNDGRFSQDGRRIITGADDQTVRVWDAADGRQLFAFESRQPVFDVGFCEGLDRVIAMGSDSTVSNPVQMWNTKDNRLIAEFENPWGNVAGWSPSCDRIAVSSPDENTGQVWITDSAGLAIAAEYRAELLKGRQTK